MSYLIESNNSVPHALHKCTGLALWQCNEILARLGTPEWCDLCRALNDGDSARVDAIIGLRAFC